MNTWHNKKLQRKRVTAAFLIMMLLLSLTGCTDTSRYKLGRGLYWLNNRQKAAVYYDPNGIDLNSAGDPIEYASEENAEFEAYLDECFKDVVTSDSLAYHNNVYDGSVYGITPPEATLGDSSYAEADVEKEKEEYEESCKRLLSFENKPLTKEERFIYECMVKEAEVGKHLFDNIYLLEPFSPMRGIQADMPSSFINFRLENKSDIELYIELLNQWKDYFDVALEFEYVKSDAGYFMSDKVADVVIEQCDEFIQEKENHFLIQTFDETIDGFDFLTEEEKQSYKEQNRDAIFNSAIPAFEDVKKTISELKGTGKNENGICYFKGGKEHYESYCFPKYTGSSKSVGEEITIMDNREIDEVMDIQIMAELSRDAVMYYSDNYSNLYDEYDKMDPTELIDGIYEKCKGDYPEIESIPYSVHYMSKPLEKIEDTTLAYYMAPPLGDLENNLIYINGAHPSGMWLTLAHEGIPGHMFQNAYYLSTDPEPYRAILTNLGYMEGWAVYSSYSSLYKCDFGGSEYAQDVAKLSILNTDLAYLTYGRIDLGVNYEGWTLEDVENYLVKSGRSKDMAEDLMTIVVGDPGVYLSYSVAYYEMEEMRKYAETELGDKFVTQEFNKTVLDAGPCYYINLKKKIDEYIRDNK